MNCHVRAIRVRPHGGPRHRGRENVEPLESAAFVDCTGSPTGCGVFLAWVWRAEDRSLMPAGPSAA